MARRTRSGLDDFLHEALREDIDFRKLFWGQVAKLPAPSRRKLEASLKDFPR